MSTFPAVLACLFLVKLSEGGIARLKSGEEEAYRGEGKEASEEPKGDEFVGVVSQAVEGGVTFGIPVSEFSLCLLKLA